MHAAFLNTLVATDAKRIPGTRQESVKLKRTGIQLKMQRICSSVDTYTLKAASTAKHKNEVGQAKQSLSDGKHTYSLHSKLQQATCYIMQRSFMTVSKILQRLIPRARALRKSAASLSCRTIA